MKICALIPSLNEAKTIGTLINRIKTQGLDVVVIDDGSIDRTAQVACQNGAYVLKNKHNMGKGASLKEGFRYILEKDYDAVVTMDGDGQHSPEDIIHFIQKAAASGADVIIGNRMTSCKNMPLIRRLTNRTMSLFISRLCKQDIPDSQCGFRLLKRNVIAGMNPVSSNYEIESEMILEAHQKGFNICSIPVQTIYNKEISQINPVIDTLRFLKFIFLHLPYKKKIG
ncbi:MAG: glycosyltransferase family 2 protein [Candidatus Omnitrophota bacterium]